jgi:excinuclease ABC subunit B
MRKAIGETERRRAIQRAYNEENGITPQSIVRPVDMALARIVEADYADIPQPIEGVLEFKSQDELDAFISKLEGDMREAAKRFEFELAAKLRDQVRELKTKEFIFT